jgi:hypothetical protein
MDLLKRFKNEPISVYDLTTGEVVQTLEGSWGDTDFLGFTPDDRYLVRLGEPLGELSVWEVDGWKFSDESSVLKKMLSPNDVFVEWVHFSSDGRSVMFKTAFRIVLFGLP